MALHLGTNAARQAVTTQFAPTVQMGTALTHK